jgi:transposase
MRFKGPPSRQPFDHPAKQRRDANRNRDAVTNEVVVRAGSTSGLRRHIDAGRETAAIGSLSRWLTIIARADRTVERLMTALGLAVLVGLAYAGVIDDPKRFAKSSSAGAYIGLTPRRFQSGEEDYIGQCSRCGDELLRSYPFEAAVLS